jgi:hypothetical protein
MAKAFLMGLLLGAWVLGSAIPAAAADVQSPYPVLAEINTFSHESLSPASMKRLEDDFSNRHDAMLLRGGKALAATDEGYGAKYRARYKLRDGFVDKYSGINDGALTEFHVRPMPIAKATALAKKLLWKDNQINFKKPSQQSAKSVTYESEASGCSSSATFQLDAKGRCIEIDLGTAC